MKPLSRLSSSLRAAARLGLDAMLPRRCLGCGKVTGEGAALCVACWADLDFITAPLCRRCGFPFEIDLGPDAVCLACLRDPPAFDRARSALRYDDRSKGLILRFKHADRTEGARSFAAWMQRSAAEFLSDRDLIVPVPLHWRRLLARRYNQAAMLAIALGRMSGVEVAPNLLLRGRDTPSQGRFSRAGRRRNVEGAFRPHPSAGTRLLGRKVLLVDDVMTTGATLEACSRALRRAGAARIDAVTLARVVLAQR